MFAATPSLPRLWSLHRRSACSRLLPFTSVGSPQIAAKGSRVNAHAETEPRPLLVFLLRSVGCRLWNAYSHLNLPMRGRHRVMVERCYNRSCI